MITLANLSRITLIVVGIPLVTLVFSPLRFTQDRIKKKKLAKEYKPRYKYLEGLTVLLEGLYIIIIFALIKVAFFD